MKNENDSNIYLKGKRIVIQTTMAPIGVFTEINLIYRSLALINLNEERMN